MAAARRRTGLLVAGGASSILAYSAHVEHCKWQAHESCKNAVFSPNGGDEILKNGLQTGDVILFNRRWYRYHLPEAFCIKLYQVLHKTEFDHCGMIVCNQYGEPFVFENTFFQGCKLRPFEKRVLHSQSQQILIVPLLPRVNFDTPALQKHIADSLSRPRYNIAGSLLYSQLHVIVDLYSRMGIRAECSTKTGIISNATIIDRQLALSLSSQPQSRETLLLSPQNVLVRTN